MAGEEFDRRMKLRSVGLDLSAVIGEVSRYLGIEEDELISATKQIRIARARALIGYIATRELPITASAVARRLNQDRSAISRATRRAHHDPEMRAVISIILEKLYAKLNQR